MVLAAGISGGGVGGGLTALDVDGELIMPEEEQQQLIEKLEKFSEVLRKRTNEFHQTGRFSNNRRNLAGLIERQNDALRAKVSQAARSRNSWAFAKAELWRDYEAMVNEFITLDDSIDADALKKS